MTTSTPLPTADAAPSMAHPSDTASEAPPAQTRAAAAVRPSLRSQIAENPLLSFFGLLIVALLAAAVASPPHPHRRHQRAHRPPRGEDGGQVRRARGRGRGDRPEADCADSPSQRHQCGGLRTTVGSALVRLATNSDGSKCAISVPLGRFTSLLGPMQLRGHSQPVFRGLGLRQALIGFLVALVGHPQPEARRP